MWKREDRVKADLHIQVLGGKKEKEVEEDIYHKFIKKHLRN